MAMSLAHQKFINDTTKQARALLEFYQLATELEVLWSGSPAYQTAITQTEIDSVANLLGAGLTLQNVADAQYVMSLVKGNIQNAIVALTILAYLP